MACPPALQALGVSVLRAVVTGLVALAFASVEPMSFSTGALPLPCPSVLGDYCVSLLFGFRALSGPRAAM